MFRKRNAHRRAGVHSWQRVVSQDHARRVTWPKRDAHRGANHFVRSKGHRRHRARIERAVHSFQRHRVIEKSSPSANEHALASVSIALMSCSPEATLGWLAEGTKPTNTNNPAAPLQSLQPTRPAASAAATYPKTQTTVPTDWYSEASDPVTTTGREAN